MRILLFFDLPSVTSAEKREYLKFRKFLIRNGFIMLQQSVYCRLTLNNTVSNLMMENIDRNKPEKGLIQVLIITEKQYSKMFLMLGENNNIVLDTTERLVVL